VSEAAVGFDHVVEVFDLHASGVALFPCGCAEGNVLVGVELFHGDGQGAVAAVFVFDVDDAGSGAFAGGSATAAGFSAGGDPSGALGALGEVRPMVSTAVCRFLGGRWCCDPPPGHVSALRRLSSRLCPARPCRGSIWRSWPTWPWSGSL